MQTADVVVVGAGVIGLSTALALADHGQRVVCLDRSRPGQGQSGGPGRIFRHLHATDELVDLAVRARPRWREWEERYGVPLLASAGAVHLPAADDGARRLASHAIAHETLAGSDVGPLLGSPLTWDSPAVLETDAGMIDAEGVVATLVGALGESVDQVEVLSLTSGGADSAVVSTASGDISCARVVVCAGTATAGFAADAGLPIEVDQALHARLLLEDPTGSRPEGVGFVDGTASHGVPVYGGNLDAHRMVLGLHGVSADPSLPLVYGDATVADVLDQARVLGDYAAAVFPDAQVVGMRRCVTTALTGEIGDAIGLWDAGPLSFLVGNNLFKFAPLLGDLLAAHALGDGPEPFFARTNERIHT